MKIELFSTQYRPYLLDSCIAVKLAPRAVRPFLDHLQRVSNSRGLAGVVQVLKLRFAALVSGDHSSFKLRGGLWVGPWRPIHRMSTYGRKGFRRALRLLRVYGHIVHPEPIEKDYKLLALRLSEKEESFATIDTSGLHPVSQAESYDTAYPLGTTSVPMGPGKNKIEYMVTPEEHVKALNNCPRLLKRHYPLFLRMVGSCLPAISTVDHLIRSTSYDVVGSVTLLTKDRGYKLRPVASAHRLIQHCLSRLSNTIYTDLRKQTCCYVFDQDAGAVWVSKQLKRSILLSSIDLTAASDNIPLGPMVEMMEKLYPSLTEDIDLFTTAQRCSWWTPFPNVRIIWKRGSIQGVKGSFPGFTRFLIYLLEDAGIPQSDFVIVGDDLVLHSYWTDKALEQLKKYSIPINYSKSLIDKKLAEFVGRVIDQHGNLGVYKGARYTENDPTGLLRQYGEVALKTPTLKKKTKRFKGVLQLANDYFDNRVLRRAMAFYSKRKSDIRTLLGESNQPFELGGCPKELFRTIFYSTSPEEWDVEFFEKKMGSLGDNLEDIQQIAANTYLQGKRPVTILERKDRPADFYTRVHTVGPDRPYQIDWGIPQYFIQTMEFPFNKGDHVKMAKFQHKEMCKDLTNLEYIDFICSGEVLDWASKVTEVPRTDPLGLLDGRNNRLAKKTGQPQRPMISTVERFSKSLSRAVLNYLVLHYALRRQ